MAMVTIGMVTECMVTDHQGGDIHGEHELYVINHVVLHLVGPTRLHHALHRTPHKVAVWWWWWWWCVLVVVVVVVSMLLAQRAMLLALTLTLSTTRTQRHGILCSTTREQEHRHPGILGQ